MNLNIDHVSAMDKENIPPKIHGRHDYPGKESFTAPKVSKMSLF